MTTFRNSTIHFVHSWKRETYISQGIFGKFFFDIFILLALCKMLITFDEFTAIITVVHLNTEE